MIPDGIKERLTEYRRWFNTLLMKDFVDLPYRQQEQFLTMVDSFQDSCRKVHEESKGIIERTISVKKRCYEISEDGNWVVVFGTVDGVTGVIEVKYPRSAAPKEEKNTLIHMVYSVDGKEWYSSKSLLARGL